MTTIHPSKPVPSLKQGVASKVAHRRMALSALSADSSLATRLKRYSHHMAIARTLETVGGAV
jgi:hypothetical protein